MDEEGHCDQFDEDCAAGAAPVPVPVIASGPSNLHYALLITAGVTCAVLLIDLTRRYIRKPRVSDKTTNTEDGPITASGAASLSGSLDVSGAGDFELLKASMAAVGADFADGALLQGRNNNTFKESKLRQERMSETVTTTTTSYRSHSSQPTSSPGSLPKPETDDKAVQVSFEPLGQPEQKIIAENAIGVTSAGTTRRANRRDMQGKVNEGGMDDEGTDIDRLAVAGQSEVFADLEEAWRAGITATDLANQDVSQTCKADITKIKELENACKNLSETISQTAAQVVENCGVDVPEDTSAASHRMLALQKDTSVLKDQWLDLQRLLFCVNLHMKHSADYQLFFYELEMLQAAMDKLKTDVKVHEKSPDYKTVPVAELRKTVSDLQQVEKTLKDWGEAIERLCVTSKTVYPVHLRSEIAEEPLPTKLVCNYRNDQVELEEGELLVLLDNSDVNTWKCRMQSGDDVELPAVCCVIPPPDINTMKAIGSLEAQYKDLNGRMREYYYTKISQLAEHISTEISNKDISSISPEQQQELMALMNDMETFVMKYFSDSKPLMDSLTLLKKRVLQLVILEETEPDAALSELIELLKIWQEIDTLYKTSAENAERRKQLVRQGTLLDTEETEWESLEEVVEARRQMAEVSVTMATETATIGETDKYEQARGETKQTFTITGVRDARDDSEMSMDEAVKRGIIDPSQGIYNNLKTGEKYPIPVAMNAGFIIVENTKTEKTRELKRSVGVVTVEFTRETRPYTIVSVLDPESQEQIDVRRGIDMGLYDADTRVYTNTKTGEKMRLEDAVDSGALLVEYDHDAEVTSEPEVSKKTFAISSVLDRKSKKRVSLDDALEAALVIKDEGLYVDTLTGEKMSIVEAMKKQYIRAKVVDDPQKIDKYMSRMRSASVESLDSETSKLSDAEQ